MCEKTQEGQFQYIVTICVQDTAGVDNIGSALLFDVFLPPEDHARLLPTTRQHCGIQSPENLDDSDGLGCIVVERDAPEEIPISRLSEDLFGKRRIRITFDMWTCYTSFFLPHLTVPWSPTVGQDQGLEERYYWSTEALS
jgi:hypothetical protein